MAVKVCPVCGTKVTCRIKVVNDGRICPACTKLSPNYSAETVEKLTLYHQEQKQRQSVFNVTRTLKHVLCSIFIDENNKLFYIGKKNDKEPMLYKFSEVQCCSIEHKETEVTKKKGGVGRAVVGGALFGVAGAVVGASTAKEVTQKKDGPAFLKLILNSHSGKWEFNLEYFPPNADQFFNSCIENIPSDNLSSDNVDKILQYKKLLDSGIITAEEFETKKKELLNL